MQVKNQTRYIAYLNGEYTVVVATGKRFWRVDTKRFCKCSADDLRAEGDNVEEYLAANEYDLADEEDEDFGPYVILNDVQAQIVEAGRTGDYRTECELKKLERVTREMYQESVNNG